MQKQKLLWSFRRHKRRGGSNAPKHQNMHEPVLLRETLEFLKPHEGESYLDLTAGYGGHAKAVLKETKSYSESVLVDRDQFAIDHLTELFNEKGIGIMKQNFYEACRSLKEQGRQFDLILADLGVSSPHLNIASRGFSFSQDGPLDMRMDQSDLVTAADIINNESEAEIGRILREYGEERRWKRASRAIVEHRPFTTTLELARTLENALGWQVKGHHPATKAFQALRIVVNGELHLLQSMLPEAMRLLAPGGRMGVITFHSLEDRIVKHTFGESAGEGYDAEYRLVTKKPVVPAHQERLNNPRSRSAKLRVVVKK